MAKTAGLKAKRRSGRALLIIGVLLLFLSLYAIRRIDNAVDSYTRHAVEIDVFFQSRTPDVFIHSATAAEPYYSETDVLDGAVSSYKAPEGFTIISYSEAWDYDMLVGLYDELKLNRHGREIETLYEIIIHAKEADSHVLASFSPGTAAVDFTLSYSALPDDFQIKFTRDIGRIELYGGDTKTTVESMAASLSHEYGHLFTFYHMFEIGNGTLGQSVYAGLREASRHDLITTDYDEDTYLRYRHRYLFETAAEDYVQLMGSPASRQTTDFSDVLQVLYGAQNPTNIGEARNAFPQENMAIPLANDVPGLMDYFYSFTDDQPSEPSEEKKDIFLQIEPVSVGHDLVGGYRSFTHYVITWNAPYQDAVYTVACYESNDYSGWALPIKTVRPGQTPSAVVGAVTLVRGDQVISRDDGIAAGRKVFYVTALLPDGTYHMSDRLEYIF